MPGECFLRNPPSPWWVFWLAALRSHSRGGDRRPSRPACTFAVRPGLDRHVGDKPLVIVLDDMYCADEASAQLLAHSVWPAAAWTSVSSHDMSTERSRRDSRRGSGSRQPWRTG